MRILWLNANLLLPLDKGGKLRTWHLLRHLARRHAITYVSFAEPGVSPELVAGMREVAQSVVTVPRREVAKRSFAFYGEVVRRLADPRPYAIARYESPEYREEVASLLGSGRFDLVVCDFLVPAVNMPRRLPCPAVLFTHNVEAEIWRRHAEQAKNPLVRALYRTQWRRMLRFEGETLSRFGLVLAVSEADRATFGRLYGPRQEASSFVVRTGVDTSYFAPRPPSKSDSRHLVFTGSMDWIPNEDAMVHFVRDILPRIRHEDPAVTLSIVGRAPTPAVRALRGHGVHVTGSVDDVRPYVADAAVYVVPLRIGGGTRLKIFEAMSMGKAVVSTTVGAEGLPVTAGHDVVLADDPGRFAAAVVELMRDPMGRRAIERRARALVVGRYDWSAVAEDLDRAIVSFAGEPAEQAANLAAVPVAE